MSNYIYLDHAATTPVDPKVRKVMSPFWNKQFGNSSSVHRFGQEAGAAITKVRKQIADFLYCQPEEIIFTSGATESNNLAIKGIANFALNLFQVQKKKVLPHIITSGIEHPAVIESCFALERTGISTSYINANKSGIVEIEQILDAITDETILISLMYVNNETGIVQNVKALGKKLIIINKKRIGDGLPRIYFHIDAVQAMNYLNCRPDHLEVDLMSISGHKVCGPKGIGLLYCRDKTPLLRTMDGGTQERTKRAGTLNTPGIVGLGKAIEIIAQTKKRSFSKVEDLEKIILDYVETNPKIILNTSGERIPGLLNVRVQGIQNEDLLIKLDLDGVGVSAGSACSSGAIKASRVLLNMGLTEKESISSIRISIGKVNTKREIKRVVKKLDKIIKEWQ